MDVSQVALRERLQRIAIIPAVGVPLVTAGIPLRIHHMGITAK